MRDDWPSDLVSLRQAAVRLAMNKESIRRWVRENKLRAWRTPGKMLVSWSEVEALVTMPARGSGVPRNAETEAILRKHGMLED